MVLNIKEGLDIQRLSKDEFSLMPWYVFGALDALELIDLSDKIVFEYGLGISTLFYAHKAKKIDGVETNLEWFRNVQETLLHHSLLSKTFLKYVPEPTITNYVLKADEVKNYDLIVIDGAERDATALSALRYAKSGTIIIIDNWMQEAVWIASQEVRAEFSKHPHALYYSENTKHLDWCTAWVTIK